MTNQQNTQTVVSKNEILTILEKIPVYNKRDMDKKDKIFEWIENSHPTLEAKTNYNKDASFLLKTILDNPQNFEDLKEILDEYAAQVTKERDEKIAELEKCLKVKTEFLVSKAADMASAMFLLDQKDKEIEELKKEMGKIKSQ